VNKKTEFAFLEKETIDSTTKRRKVWFGAEEKNTITKIENLHSISKEIVSLRNQLHGRINSSKGISSKE
jgi:hypothetical protein